MTNLSYNFDVNSEHEEILVFANEDERRAQTTKNLKLDGIGLEIAPLFRPNVLKKEHNVYYTDYLSTEELRKKNIGNPGLPTDDVNVDVAEIDFVWEPGKKLIDTVRKDLKFDYVIASHVIEHVPNVIGWLQEILDVMKVGGTLSLIIPDKRICMDMHRSETEVSELLDAWITNPRIPSPKQIYDCLSHAVDVGGLGARENYLKEPSVRSAQHPYTKKQALEYAISSWASNTYLDMHCTTYTPTSFTNVFNELVELGIINVQIFPPEISGNEFFVQMIKTGEPRIKRPAQSVITSPNAVQTQPTLFSKLRTKARKLSSCLS